MLKDATQRLCVVLIELASGQKAKSLEKRSASAPDTNAHALGLLLAIWLKQTVSCMYWFVTLSLDYNITLDMYDVSIINASGIPTDEARD